MMEQVGRLGKEILVVAPMLHPFEHIFLHNHDMLFLVYRHFTCSFVLERNISWSNHPTKVDLSHRNNPITHLNNMVNHPTKVDLNHRNNPIIHLSLSSRLAHHTHSNPCISHLHQGRGAGPGSGL